MSCGRELLRNCTIEGKYTKRSYESFFPFASETAALPTKVPDDIEAEFREAELCSAAAANRGASALFRSTLEKTLKTNGYEDLSAKGHDKMRLQAKIDEAAADGIITEALRNRAHDEIRVLGNDVLHDSWMVISDEDVDAAYHYTQRILEAFYDHRDSVEKILIAKKRINAPKSEDPGAS